MTRIAGILIAAALTATSAYGEIGQNESESGWFLNPQTQNWSCNVFLGKTPIASGFGGGACKANDVANLAYVAAQPVKVWNGSAYRYYFYVQEFSSLEGPGSECWGDSILIFETPYTANGAKASGVTPVYRGTANPPEHCSGSSSERSHWAFGSAFYDPNVNRVFLIAQRTKWDGPAFKDLWIGESAPEADGSYGKRFTWTKMLQTTMNDHAMFRAFFVPDTGQWIWRGFMANQLGLAVGGTPIIINRAQGTLQYKTGPSTWVTLAFPGTIDNNSPPPYIQHASFMSSFVKVNNRFELWWDDKQPSGSQRPMVPCPDTPYLTNASSAGRNGDSQGPKGSNLSYIVLDANLTPISGPFPLSSDTHPLPANELWSVIEPHSANIVNLAGSTLYYGSNDWSICNVPLNTWNAWSGSGIKWGRLVVW
jgi:hypothetical protein